MEFVTILHPHHPLRGQRCEVVRIRRGADPDVILRLPDGSHAAIALSWTDYGSVAPKGRPRADLPLLDLNGLRQAARLIERLRQEGRVPLRRRSGPRRSSAPSR